MVEWAGIIITLIIASFGGIWAYARYVLERNLLPSVQPDLICYFTGVHDDKKIIEIILHLKNVGPSTFVVRNIKLKLRYISTDEKSIRLFGEFKNFIPRTREECNKEIKLFGRLVFPHSLREDLEKTEKNAVPAGTEGTGEKTENKARDKEEGIPLVKDMTFFVRPEVDQIFSFVTGLPPTALFLLVHAEFHYVQNITSLRHGLLLISQYLGLIQFKLEDIRAPHTIERVFKI
jgi:hypothetical protein